FVGIIFRPQTPAVRLNDRVRNRQTQPHATWLGREERLKQMLDVVRQNALTHIADRHFDIRACGTDAHSHGTFFGLAVINRVDRVEDEVEQYLLQLYAITTYA